MATTIVFADESDAVRTTYAPGLRAAGYDVWEAGDGREALDLIHVHHPALLVLDLGLPILSGLEVLAHLLHDPEAARLKIVVLSSRGDSDSRLTSFGAGADEYLLKDLPLGDLLASLRSVLGPGLPLPGVA